LELRRRGALEPVVGDKVEPSHAGATTECTVGGGIKRDLVVELGKLEK
jgi:hypothetical protein